MPRYFFDVHDDIETLDEAGLEFPSLEVAREQAIEDAREMASEGIRRLGRVDLDHFIDVRDEAGEVMLTLTFRQAFTVRG